jgi:hypothetical protein
MINRTTDSAASSAGPLPLAPKSGRPFLVWVILIFYLFAGASSLAQIRRTLTGADQRVDARGRPYTTFDYLESLAFIGLKVAAAVMLFRLRRSAFPLFLAIMVLNAVATGYDLLTKGLPPPGGAVIVASMTIGFGMLMAICFYAWRLQRKGVLK